MGSVPKTIGFFLVRSVEDKLQFEIYSALNKEQRIAELLGEPAHIQEERKTLMAQLQTLQKAHAVLTRDPMLASISFEGDDEADEAAPSKPASKPTAAAAANNASSAFAPTARTQPQVQVSNAT